MTDAEAKALRVETACGVGLSEADLSEIAAFPCFEFEIGARAEAPPGGWPKIDCPPPITIGPLMLYRGRP